jgi:hypothetical protein
MTSLLNSLTILTLKARSSAATVPVTRANTPDRSMLADSPSRRMRLTNARRVLVLAP